MFSVEIERFVPRFLLRDKNGFALAKAIEAGLNAMNRSVEQGLEYLINIETMPEWRLDELAWEYCVDWYDRSAEVSEKRKMIAGAVASYTRLGTVYIIKSAVETIFGAGRVEEWFQYEGTPYHFRIFADSAQMSGSGSDRLKSLVDKIKNLRSVLDEICFTGESEEAAMLFAATAATGMQIRISATAQSDVLDEIVSSPVTDASAYTWTLERNYNSSGSLGRQAGFAITHQIYAENALIVNYSDAVDSGGKTTSLFVHELKEGNWLRRKSIGAGESLRTGADTDAVRLAFGYSSNQNVTITQEMLNENFAVKIITVR